MRTFPNRSEPGGMRNPQTSAQLSGMDQGSHNGGGAPWLRQGTISESFVKSTDGTKSKNDM